MLFNSYSFIFAFLPLTLLVFFLFGRVFGKQVAILWLVACSLFLYILWDPSYWWVITTTILVNYFLGTRIMQVTNKGGKKALLWIGVIANIAFLAWFKFRISGLFAFGDIAYEDIQTFNTSKEILIPLAISFITFQQIIFLVDSYKDRCVSTRFSEYILFITFFPQLIMGPIVHQREIVPQFQNPDTFQFNKINFSVGLSIFIVGLFKKTVLADSLSGSVNIIYAAAFNGEAISLVDAWIAAGGFLFQLYFDFSGYADMAIGIAKMLNINLPLNFDSPLKARNRFEFWRRWHITFSEFMKHNVYMPLVRNKSIPLGRYSALLVSTFLSGLWHGIGLTFIAWGLIQGLILIVGHKYRELRRSRRNKKPDNINPRVHQIAMTLLVTTLISVLFRSGDMQTALNIYAGLFGFNGLVIPSRFVDSVSSILTVSGTSWTVGPLLSDVSDIFWLLLCFTVTYLMPSTKQYFEKYWTALDQRGYGKHQQDKSTLLRRARPLMFKLNYRSSLIISILFFLSLYSILESSRFIYYQF